MDLFEKVELLSAGHCASFEYYVISRDCVYYAFCVESLHVFVDGFCQLYGGVMVYFLYRVPSAGCVRPPVMY